MKSNVERAITIGFALALFFMTGIGALSYWITLRVDVAAQERTHTNQARLSLETLLAQLNDIESSQRGFIITGKNSYLRSYDTRVSDIAQIMTELRQSTAEDPFVQQNLDKLAALIDARLALLQRTIDTRQNLGLEAAIASIDTDQGKILMDAIQKIISDIHAIEDTKFTQRDAKLNNDLQTARDITLLGGLLAVGLITLSGTVIRRGLIKRKRAEAKILHINRLYATISQINQTIVRTKDRDTLFSEICRVAVEHGKFRMAWVGLLDESNEYVRPIVFAGEEQGYLTNARIVIHDPKLGSGPTGTAIREGRCIICQDIATDPRMAPWREQAIQRGYRSSAAVPIRQKNRLVGTLTVYAPDPQSFDNDDQQLLDEIGLDISYALDSMDADAERKRAEDALQESEEHYRSVVTAMAEGVVFQTADGKITSVNPAAEKIEGRTFEQMIGHTSDDPQWGAIHEDGTPFPGELHPSMVTLRTGEPQSNVIMGIHQPDGKLVWISINSQPMMSPGESKPYAVVTTFHDVTERKQVQAEREQYFKFFQTSTDMMCIADPNGAFLKINPACSEVLGYSDAELVARPFIEFVHPDDKQSTLDEMARQMQKGFSLNFENRYVCKDGSLRWLSWRANYIESEGVTYATARDITEKKRADEALRSAAHYTRSLIEASLDPLVTISPDGKITDVNQATEAVTGVSRERLIGDDFSNYFTEPENAREGYKKVLTEGMVRDYPLTIRHTTGNTTDVLYNATIYTNTMGEAQGVFAAAHDITERKRAEEANRLHIHFLESLEQIDKVIRQETDIEQMLKNVVGKVLVIFNCDRTWLFYPCDPDAPTFRVPIEISRPEYPGANALNLEVPMDPGVAKDLRDALASEDPIPYTLGTEKPVNTLTAQQFAVQAQMFMAIYPKIGKPWVFGIHQCSHPRIWTDDEKVLFKEIGHRIADGLSTVLFFRDLRESEEQFRTLVNQAADAIFLYDMEGHLLNVNQRACDSLGYTREELLEMNIADVDAEFISRNHVSTIWSQPSHDHPVTLESMQKRKDGTTFPVEVRLGPLQIEEEQSILALARDITERKKAEERIKRQLERLSALSEIDRMIASSFDLRLSLTSIVDRVISQQKVDASDILLMNPDLNILEFGTGNGFRTLGIEKGHLSLGEGYAGRAALERQTIHIADLRTRADNPTLQKTFASDNFVSYYAVPLIAKGKVKGVLEIFHRSQLNPDFEWLDFLNTLAGQAALAIDNATLFGNLQRSNTELALAYDATIEGWSRALDLRDKETEGHSLRVTEIVVSLASKFGLRDSELVQIRWGSLLHDIGKMGLPDSILLKPDALTEQEWVLMRSHPVLGYKLLSPIGFLRSALDIPYCHHEKWDGTGYPRGLKGEQIPLSARIFAVVDVWDALTSDRVYRNAWPNEKALDYIKSQAGIHFDPQVVKVCFESVVLERESQKRTNGSS